MTGNSYRIDGSKSDRISLLEKRKKSKRKSRQPKAGKRTPQSTRVFGINNTAGDSNVRGTPPQEFIKHCRIFNFYPKIDFAGDALHHMCQDYITEQIDTFSKDWVRNGFLNPEYSDIKIWMQYAVEMWKRYDINLLVLTFSKTGVGWWQDYVEPYRKSGEALVEFPRGRYVFTDELGWLMDNNSTDDSAWIFYKSKLFPSEMFCPFNF